MAEAWWHVTNSALVTPQEKELIFAKLINKINKDGYLVFKSSETRSQLENKSIALNKLQEAVAKSLIIPKKRKASRPSKSAIEKRLTGKKRTSAKKESRKSNWDE